MQDKSLISAATAATPRAPLYISLGFCLFILSLFLVGITGLALGQGISPWSLLLAVLLFTLTFFLFLHPLNWGPEKIQILALTGAGIILSVLVCGYMIDSSWDGQWYHQVAIDRLMDHWNPLYEPFYSRSKFDSWNFLWVQHYPKFTWISGAVIASGLGAIETAKALQPLLALAVFFNALNFCRQQGMPKAWGLLAAMIIALNPVAVTQLFSDYVDGSLGELLILLLLQLVSLHTAPREYPGIKWFLAIFSVVLLVNTKFSGILLSGFFLFIFFIFWWLQKTPFPLLARRLLGWSLVYLLAIAVLGYNPYVVNLRAKGHPFYPVNTKTAYDSIITRNTPAFMLGKPTPQQLLYSVFSQSDNNIHDQRPLWKFPLVVHPYEVTLFSTTDVRLGGFGPLFQLSIWLSLLLLGTSAFRKGRPRQGAVFLAVMGCLLLTGLFLPESWWARFAPQVFLIPVAIALACWKSGGPGPGRLQGLLPKTVLLVLALNLLLIGGANWTANIIKTRLIRREMAEMKTAGKPIRINFNGSYFQAIRRRLREAGVPFEETDSLQGPTRELRTLYKLEGFGPRYEWAPEAPLPSHRP